MKQELQREQEQAARNMELHATAMGAVQHQLDQVATMAQEKRALTKELAAAQEQTQQVQKSRDSFHA